MTGGFTGRHMAVIMVAFFGVVIAVNLVMANLAIGTFGGVVVENSYVASQKYNRWLDEAKTEAALGWKAHADRRPDGRIEAVVAGVPTGDILVSAIARHPLGRLPDRALAFAALGDGRFLSLAPLPQGRWRLRLEVLSAGRSWRTEEDIR